METGLTREEALQALQTYNHEPFHLQHALTVEAVMAGSPRKRDSRRKATSGTWRGCCMTLTLSSGLNSIA